MNNPTGSPRLGWLAPVTIGILLVATVAAFGFSQRLKREPLVIDRVEYRVLGQSEDALFPRVFSPNGDCRRDRMGIHFRTTKSDNADVEITGPGGQVLRTLARDRFFKRYREHDMVWNGMTDQGEPAPQARYRVRVTMHGEGRQLYLPGYIRVQELPPIEPSNCVEPRNDDSQKRERPASADQNVTGGIQSQ